jgi:hypothetical protein
MAGKKVLQAFSFVPYEAGCKIQTATPKYRNFRPTSNSPSCRHLTPAFLLFQIVAKGSILSHICIIPFLLPFVKVAEENPKIFFTFYVVFLITKQATNKFYFFSKKRDFFI